MAICIYLLLRLNERVFLKIVSLNDVAHEFHYIFLVGWTRFELIHEMRLEAIETGIWIMRKGFECLTNLREFF